MSDETEAFYARHAEGGPNHVVLAMALRADGNGFRCEVFSTLPLAHAWSDALSDTEFISTVFAPHIIDVPEYGNVPKEKRQ